MSSYTKVNTPLDLVKLIQERGGKIDGIVIIDGDDQALGYYCLEFNKESFDGTISIYRNGVFQESIKIRDLKHCVFVPEEDDA